MVARVLLPREARRGEKIEVRIVIQHPMETGYRLDADNRAVPKNAIRLLICRLAGEEVFRAELSPGIAANPYLVFHAIAEKSGDLELSWVDDAGVRDSARQPLVVAG
jgi:sulfur-oxidizing protein SoxZ